MNPISRSLAILLLPFALLGTAGLFQLRVSAQSEKPLTNQDVIRLVKLGLSADVIITKISQVPASFDLSTDGLIALAKNNVPNDVIKAMQAKVRPYTRSAEPTALTASSDKSPTPSGRSTPRNSSYPVPPDKGAYLWDGAKLHLLNQNPVTSMGENFWRHWTPFVKKKFELQLIGPFAKTHYDNTQPVIVVSGLGEIIPGIPAYRLLYVKTGGMLKDRRVVGTYDVGGFFGSARMVDNEIECEISKVTEGIYAITPGKPLQDGEYGLVQVPKLADMSSRPSFAPPVWDFGIYAEGRSGQVTR